MKTWGGMSLVVAVAVVAACSTHIDANHPVGSGSESPNPVLPQAGSDKGQVQPPGFPGFEGPPGYYLPEVITDKGVNVLDNSITMTQAGNWRAWGLVRNDSPNSVGEVVVTATLYDKSGHILDKPSTTIPVNPLRSGEPGPFELKSEVTAPQVTRVEWSTQSGTASPNTSRAIDVLVYWQVPYGVAEWKGIKRDDPPYPHLMQVGLENKGQPLSDANLAVAWVDKGRVVWVETSILDPQRTKVPIPTGGNGEFKTIRILDDQMEAYHKEYGAEYLYRLDYLLWAWGD